MALLVWGLSLDVQSHQRKEQKSEMCRKISELNKRGSHFHLLGRFQLLLVPTGGFFQRAEFPGNGHDLQGAGCLLWVLI